MASIFDTVRDLERLRQIVAVLLRHGFGEVVERMGLATLARTRSKTPADPYAPKDRSPGVRLRLVFQDLGPTFIKLGQLLSTRGDLLPEDIIVELRKLQDDVPALPYDEIRHVIEEQLGGAVTDIYVTLDTTPLATASIGQVHRATLRTSDGTEDVVVKVQRPGIRNTIERDLDLLYWFAHLIERSIPESRVYSPARLVAEFDRAITSELDYQLEADNATRFRANFEGDARVRFPRVFREASSKKVLTLEYLAGQKLQAALQSGYNRECIAKDALGLVVKQVFDDGFFHADPHPGNILVLGEPDKPVLGLIDLGLVGRLSPELRDRTVDLLLAAVQSDYRNLADALYALGRPKRRIDRSAFDSEVGRLADRYLGKSLSDVELSEFVRDLVQCATRFELEVPPEFMMVAKTLMTVEGVGKEIYPELDIVAELRPHVVDIVRRRFSPERISGELWRTAQRLGGAAVDVPQRLEALLWDMQSGNLTVQVREQGLSGAAERLGRRVFSGLVVSSLVLSGTLLLTHAQWIAGAVTLGVAATWLFGHSALLIIQRFREPPAR